MAFGLAAERFERYHRESMVAKLGPVVERSAGDPPAPWLELGTTLAAHAGRAGRAAFLARARSPCER